MILGDVILTLENKDQSKYSVLEREKAEVRRASFLLLFLDGIETVLR